jgi:hypothetical protein
MSPRSRKIENQPRLAFDTPPPFGGGSRSLLDSAGWPLLLCVLGILATGYPTLISGFAEVQGGLGDPLLVNFTLEHSYRWVTGMPLASDLWSPPIFHPERGVATYTDLLLGTAPLYWLWRMVGCEPHTAYQCWMLCCWSINFFACYLLLGRGFRISAFAAAMGATLFAFGSPRMANVMHQQLVVQFFLVVSIWAAIELVRLSERPRTSWRNWLWVGVLLTSLLLQFMTAFYPLFFALFAAVAALAASLLSASKRRVLLRVLRQNALPLAVFAILTAIAATPVLLRYLHSAEILGYRNYSARTLPRLASWFLLGKSSLMFGRLHEIPWLSGFGMPRHHNGIGFVTTVLAAIGLWNGRRNRAVQLLLVGLAALFVFTLRLPGDLSLWQVVRELVPGAASLRAVARVGMMTMFPAALGIAIFMNRTVRRSVWLTAALSIIMMAEQLHTPITFNKRSMEEKVAEIASRVPDDAEAFLLVSAPRASRYDPHDTAAWVAFATNVPTVNGRYGHRPRKWRFRNVDAATSEDIARIRRFLRYWVKRNDLNPSRVVWLPMEPGAAPSTLRRR